jgi:hypothetical protein
MVNRPHASWTALSVCTHVCRVFAVVWGWVKFELISCKRHFESDLITITRERYEVKVGHSCDLGVGHSCDLWVYASKGFPAVFSK